VRLAEGDFATHQTDEMNTLVTLAGRTADPHRPGACEVANLQEVSRSMGKQSLIVRLRGIRRPEDFP
jgi:hypothetical protein